MKLESHTISSPPLLFLGAYSNFQQEFNPCFRFGVSDHSTGQRNNQFGCLGGPGGGAVIIFAGAVSCGGDGTCSVSADAISAGSPAGAACGNDGGGGGGAG